MTYTTHESLLKRLSEGVDPLAWKQFHDRYIELIRGVAFRYGLQPADSEDLAQEVLFALSKAMKGFEYDRSRGKFRSYLKTLTLHKIFEFSRQKRARGPLIEDLEGLAASIPLDPQLEAVWEDEWRQYHVRRAMARLESEFAEKDRTAFSYYAIKGRTADETASCWRRKRRSREASP